MEKIEKVIKGIEKCIAIPGMCRGCPYEKCDEVGRQLRDCSTDVLRDALELLKAQPKWIPINERKPNSCGTYIVARWFIDGCRRKILTDACYFDGSNTWHDDTRVNHSRPYLTDKIVAWMSLPNPPKDGERE